MSTVFTGGLSRSAFGVLQGIVIAKYLGAASFGKYAYAMAVVGLVFGLADFRIQEAVIKFTAGLRQTGGQAQVYALSAFFIVLEGAKGAVGFLIILGAASAFFGSLANISNDVGHLLIVLGLYQLFMSFNPTLTAWLRLGERFRTIAYDDGVFGLLQFVATATAAIQVVTVESVAFAYALTGLFGGISKFFIVAVIFSDHLRRLGSVAWFSKAVFGRLPWRNIWRFLVGVNLASTLRLVARQVDVLILAMFIPMESVGTYSLAKKLKNVFFLITDPLLTVIYPEYAKQFARKSYISLEHLFSRMTKTAMAAASIGGGIAMFVAPFFLPLVFGEEYRASIVLFQVFLVDAVLLAGVFSLGPMVLAVAKPRLMVFGAAIRLVVIASAGMLFSPLFGALGMTVSVVLSTIVSQAYIYVAVKAELRKRINELPPTQ